MIQYHRLSLNIAKSQLAHRVLRSGSVQRLRAWPHHSRARSPGLRIKDAGSGRLDLGAWWSRGDGQLRVRTRASRRNIARQALFGVEIGNSLGRGFARKRRGCARVHLGLGAWGERRAGSASWARRERERQLLPRISRMTADQQPWGNCARGEKLPSPLPFPQAVPLLYPPVSVESVAMLVSSSTEFRPEWQKRRIECRMAHCDDPPTPADRVELEC